MTHIVDNGDNELETLCGLSLLMARPLYTIPAHTVEDEPLPGPTEGSDLRCPKCWTLWRTWRQQEDEWDAEEE